MRNLQDMFDNHSADPYADAVMKHAQKEFAGAIEIYKKILGENPSDRQVSTKLAMCYREWIFDLTKKNAPAAEVKQVVLQALECCPNSEILRDFHEYASGESQ